MADIQPFRGIRYNLEKIGDISLVVAPVYDIINSQERNRHYERHPQNVIRLILPRNEAGKDSSSRYEFARRHFQEWLSKGILVQDPEPHIYVYRQLYLLGGKLREAIGLVARVRLEEFDEGEIFPHEKTLEKPFKDRISLIRSCRANFSQILAFYSDPEGELSSKLALEMERFPLEQFHAEDGVSHTIWSIGDPKLLRWTTRFLKKKKLLIADGHHRYQTALEFSSELASQLGENSTDAPYRYVMMHLWRLEDPGITLLPVHRLVKGIEGFSNRNFLASTSRWFNCEEIAVPSGATSGEVYSLLSRLEEEGASMPAFGLYMGGEKFYLLSWKKELDLQNGVSGEGSIDYKRLDVTVLRRLLIEDCLGISPDLSEVESHIEFNKDPIKVARDVDRGRGQLAFFVNPPRVEAVKSVAMKGEKMPQKSTYFYPKPLSGTIMNRITDD